MLSELRALASEPRLLILHWLKDPAAHFPPQVDGDLVADGVCSLFIANKLNMTQPSATGHLKILERAGLEVLVVGDPAAGHNLNERMQVALRKAWPEISAPVQ